MKTLAAVALFCLLTLGFFWDVTVGPDILLDANPYHFDPWKAHASGSDLDRKTYMIDSFTTYYPRYVFLSESIRSGRFPLWNPEVFAGMPFLADPQSRAAYPVSLMLTTVSPKRAMGYDVAIHVFLAMLGMYLFLRAIRTTATAAVWGATAYAFSSYFYVRYGHPTLVASAAWVPFFFYAYEIARARERLGTLLLTSFLTLGYLAGFPQVFLLGVLALVAYAFFIAVDHPEGPRRPALAGAFRVLGIAGGISALVVSIQLVPFWELFRNSVGLSYSFDYIKEYLLAPPVVLLRAVLPGVFGSPADGTDWSGLLREAVHPYNPEFAVFCGTGALIAALTALGLFRQSPRVRVLSLLLALSVAVAVEPHVARLGHALLPMFRAARVSRVAVVACFALSALAAVGFSALSLEEHRRLRKHVTVAVIAVIGCAFVALVVFHTLGESILGGLASKARSLPNSFWGKMLVESQSGKIRQWAESDIAGWLEAQKRPLLMGTLMAAASGGMMIVFCHTRASRPRLEVALGLVVVGLAAFDVIHTARGYRLCQAASSITETAGVKALKDLLGDGGRWRMKTFRSPAGDKIALPPNTNQAFGVYSLLGLNTISTRAYADLTDAYVSSKKDKHREVGALRTPGLGISWLTNSLDDLMGVRGVVADLGQVRLGSSLILRAIPGDSPVLARLKMLKIGRDARLALGQNVGETLTFRAALPPVDLLCFSVGFDIDNPVDVDSLVFVLECRSKLGRVGFRRAFDAQSGRGVWHEVGLNVASIKNSTVDFTVSVRHTGPGAGRMVRAGWSGFDLAVRECVFTRWGQGYLITLGGPEPSLGVELASSAREVPLDILYEDGSRTRRVFAFPPEGRARKVRIDLDCPPSGRLLVRSDSTFEVRACRQIPREWGTDMDCELVFDEDMSVYENSRAVDKGVCLDRDSVRLDHSSRGRVLALAELDDVWPAVCGQCRMVSYKPEEVVLEVSSDRSCFVVFQDMQYPGWKVQVDGVAADFVPTDIGIRAVEMASGEHRVVMSFQPRSFYVGAVLTCLGCALLVAYACLPKWARARCCGARWPDLKRASK